MFMHRSVQAEAELLEKCFLNGYYSQSPYPTLP